MHGAGRDSLITETLRGSRTRCPCHDISESALKVVLSYYPVCRCQRTSIHVHFRAQKNSTSCPTITSACPPWRVADNHAGTKLSPICSPKCTRTTPNAFGARFQRNNKISPD